MSVRPRHGCFVVMLLAAGACARGNEEPAPIKPIVKNTIPKAGGVLGIRMGSSIDLRGAVVEPGVTFAATSPSIAAVIPIGALPAPGTLHVEWRRMRRPGPEGRIFSQDIPVRPFDRAFATAVSPGRIAAGWYEVSATLGAETATAYWRVPSKRSDRARGGPPTAGRSGVVARQSAPAAALSAAPAPCTRVSGIYPQFVFGWIDGEVRAMDADCDTLLLFASINAPPQLVERADGDELAFRLYPCKLEGGTDVPGTVVHLFAFVKGHQDLGVQRDLALEDGNLEGPAIYLDAPGHEAGSIVAPGERIPLHALAFELAPSPGIRWVEVSSPGGSLGRIEKESKPCDADRHMIGWRAGTLTYVVPEDDPPPVIEIRGTAEDHANRRHTEIIRFATARKGYEFKPTRFEFVQQGGRNFYCLVSGRVCGDPFHQPWKVSLTCTNSIDPTGTATFDVEVRVPEPNVEATGAGSEYAERLRLTIYPGAEPRVRVAEYLGDGTRQEATVPLLKTRACGTDAGPFDPMTGWQAEAEQ